MQELNAELLQDLPLLARRVATYKDASTAEQMRVLQYLVHNYPHSYVQTVTFNTGMPSFQLNLDRLAEALPQCLGRVVRLVIDGKVFLGATALGLITQMVRHQMPKFLLYGHDGRRFTTTSSDMIVSACLVSETPLFCGVSSATVTSVPKHTQFVKHAKAAFLVDGTRPAEHGHLPVGVLLGDASVATVGAALLAKRGQAHYDFLSMGQRIIHKSQWLSISEAGWVCRRGRPDRLSNGTMPDGVLRIPSVTKLKAITQLTYRPVFLFTGEFNCPWQYVCHGKMYRLDHLLAFYTNPKRFGAGWQRNEDYPHWVTDTKTGRAPFWPG